MSKALQFIHLYESIALDDLLSQEPEMPKEDYHFTLRGILNHPMDFDIVVQKLGDIAAHNHILGDTLFIKAKINVNDYIDAATAKAVNGEIRVSNNKLDVGYNHNGELTEVYLNTEKVKVTDKAILEDIHIRGCSKQMHNVLTLTFER